MVKNCDLSLENAVLKIQAANNMYLSNKQVIRILKDIR